MQQGKDKAVKNREIQVKKLEYAGFGPGWDAKYDELSKRPDGDYKLPYTGRVNNVAVEVEINSRVKAGYVYFNSFDLASFPNQRVEHANVNGVDTLALERRMATTDFSKYFDENKPTEQLSNEDKKRIVAQTNIMQDLNKIASDPQGNEIMAKLAVKYFRGTIFAEQIPDFETIKKNYQIQNQFPLDFTESYTLRQAVNLFKPDRWVKIDRVRNDQSENVGKDGEANKDLATGKDEGKGKNGKKAVHQEVGKPTPEEKKKVVREKVWVKLDMTKRTEKKGNFMRVYRHGQTEEEIKSVGLSFDLDAKLAPFAFNQTVDTTARRQLVWSMEQGNDPAVSWTNADGKPETGRISAVADKKSFSLRKDTGEYVRHDMLPRRKEMDLASVLAPAGIIEKHFGKESIPAVYQEATVKGLPPAKQQENGMGM
ncbi:hypothetical protein [Chitinophaga rhizophila]|uniref:DUF3945 domain-containing protein n=1 Tax=Chitinophaga rhizophila TaxID=2866212 RepID=A0ABS7G704_9BACT|nr:hypothetical protein [Chitinophaga rhizophila]MBW8683438.1 hypothetical protein [Chitinophaga rhizophila]